jgi:hypothetical protein
MPGGAGPIGPGLLGASEGGAAVHRRRKSARLPYCFARLANLLNKELK